MKLLVAAVMGLLTAGVAEGDVWDLAAANDNGAATRTFLIHGTDQVHDLGVQPGSLADEDWYRMPQAPYSSYEVVVEGMTGDLWDPSSAFPSLHRIGADGTTIVQGAVTVLGTVPLTLSWQNNAAGYRDDLVRVGGAACTLTCTTDDQYRIRAYDTTAAIPRFNNAGTQVTVLILQNPAEYTIVGTAWFWSAPGALLGERPFTLGPKQALVLATASVSGAAGQSGTVTVSHTGRYGDLAGKTVALEPSSGYSFDTPMLWRPR